MDINYAVTEMLEALEQEIKSASKDSSKHLDVFDGRLLAETSEGFLYSFSADARTQVAPETPVEFQAHKSYERLKGIWIGQEDFEILLALSEKIPTDCNRGKVIMNLTFILRELIGKLSQIKDAPGINLARSLIQQTVPSDHFTDISADSAIRAMKEEGIELNALQETALRNSISRPVHFIWGPPGTGKTANLAQICRALADSGESLLVVAHAHAAIDVAMLRIGRVMRNSTLLRQGRILRLGITQSDEVRRHDSLTAFAIMRKKEPDLLDEWDALQDRKRELHQILNSGNSMRIASAETELSQVRKRLQQIRQRLQELEAEIVEDAAVVGCTAAKAIIDGNVWKKEFDTVIIDEVSMMNFPYVVTLGARASKRILMFGDFKQLPPIVVADTDMALKWLANDAFYLSGVATKIAGNASDPRITMLREQYRMHSSICQVVSALNYDGKLVTAEGVDERNAPIADVAPASGYALVLADTSAFNSICLREQKPGRYSRLNPIHAVICANLAFNNLESGQSDLCIVTPYRAQAKLISAICSDLDLDVEVATVHKFQGSECGTVIFDLCDAFPQKKASRLTGHAAHIAERLINVAISRAKGKLIVLADYAFIKESHDGRSPARKLSSYLVQHGTHLMLDPEHLDLDLEVFNWYDNFFDLQSNLVSAIEAETPSRVNLPGEFRSIANITMPQQKVSGQFAEAGGLHLLFSNRSIIGGSCVNSPVVTLPGQVTNTFSKLFEEDEVSIPHRGNQRRNRWQN